MDKGRDEYDGESRSSKRRNKDRDWGAGLPDLIVEMIYERVPLLDRRSFKQVCKCDWYVTASKYDVVERKQQQQQQQFPPRGIPWLVMSGKHRSRLSRKFYSVLEGEEEEPRRVKLSLPKARGHYLWGSFHDWLIAVKPVKHRKEIDITMLNPFSGAHVCLPRVNDHYHKLVLSGSPLDPTCCIYMLLGIHYTFSLWIPNPNPDLVGIGIGIGIGLWRRCYLNMEQKYATSALAFVRDAIFFRGSFYMLGPNCNIRILDAQHARARLHSQPDIGPIGVDTRLYELQIIPDFPKATTEDESTAVTWNLVESGGNILMVCQFFERVAVSHGSSSSSSSSCVRYEVKVYKLKLDQMAWVEINDLEGQVLFLGTNCSKSYPWRHVGGLPNCIYSTSTHEGGIFDDDDDFESSGHWSIFELGKDKFFYIIKQQEQGDDDDKFSYSKNGEDGPPLWVTAPL